MTVFQVGVAPGSEKFELRAECHELIARRDEDRLRMKRYAAQTAIGTSPLPVDIHGIPVQGLNHLLVSKVDEIHATMAITLFATADDGCCY